MIKYFTIEDLLKHYLQKKFHILSQQRRLLKHIDFHNLQSIYEMYLIL